MCPKCEKEMVKGYTPDRAAGYTFRSVWIEGEPKDSTMLGMDTLKLKERQIQSFRCPSCGMLLQFAP